MLDIVPKPRNAYTYMYKLTYSRTFKLLYVNVRMKYHLYDITYIMLTAFCNMVCLVNCKKNSSPRKYDSD